ncbi:MAG TPA: hypothetical protein VN665_01130 [Candidatus Paceibacterota bacterium]|nr:hypothetical protein [Candidatus Paceibacterota bacterium]
MKFKNTKSVSGPMPRLLIESSKEIPTDYVGFLQIDAFSERIKIGRAEGREFRLVQCLFSPKNFLSAKYEPVVQTHGRLFEAIRVSNDALNTRLFRNDSAESEMELIVEKSLKNLQEGEAGKHLSFVSEAGRVRMEVI